MPKRKKSKKRSKANPNLIVVVLTDDTEFKKSMDDINNKKKVGFYIEDAKQKIIPVVRARNHPVQRDPCWRKVSSRCDYRRLLRASEYRGVRAGSLQILSAAVPSPRWQANALDKKKETQNSAEMHALKTSRKRSIKTPNVLVTTLTEEQRKKAGESVRKHDAAKFEIVGIQVKGIPNVRVSNHPVQKPTPTPPEPPPPPPGD
jgi:hypothetical protein